jgi:hypothetical protein
VSECWRVCVRLVDGGVWWVGVKRQGKARPGRGAVRSVTLERCDVRVGIELGYTWSGGHDHEAHGDT